MAKRITNLELRGRTWYYRVSFTLNRKTFALRLSLETADAGVARERASRMDLALKRRWREVVASPIPMTEDEKQSIMRAAALDARRSLERIEGDHLATAYETPDGGQYDLLQTLRGLQKVVRDICMHGLNRSFGTREYEMHLLDGCEPIGREELGRLREVIEGGDDLAAGFRERAGDALRRRNVEPPDPAHQQILQEGEAADPEQLGRRTRVDAAELLAYRDRDRHRRGWTDVEAATLKLRERPVAQPMPPPRTEPSVISRHLVTPRVATVEQLDVALEAVEARLQGGIAKMFERPGFDRAVVEVSAWHEENSLKEVPELRIPVPVTSSAFEDRVDV